jgi:lysophospholipase L1-like esterase
VAVRHLFVQPWRRVLFWGIIVSLFVAVGVGYRWGLTGPQKQVVRYLLDDLWVTDNQANLLLGSSSIKYMDEALLSGCGSWLNRGIGNAYIDDVLQYMNLTTLNLEPAHIWIYLAENDIANQKTDIIEDYRQLVNLLLNRFTSSQVHIIAVKPSPARVKYHQKFMKFNEQLRQMAESLPRVSFYNGLDSSNTPSTELYQSDGIHLTNVGEAIFFQGMLSQCHPL